MLPEELFLNSSSKDGLKSALLFVTEASKPQNDIAFSLAQYANLVKDNFIFLGVFQVVLYTETKSV